MSQGWEDQRNAHLYEEYVQHFPLIGLDYAIRMEILDKAYAQFDQEFCSRGQWRYYGMERP